MKQLKKLFIFPIAFTFLSLPTVAQINQNRAASMVCPPIAYPKQSRLNEEEGTVLVLIKVNKNSTVGGIVIEKSSGHRQLDSAVVELIQKCQTVAATRDSIPYDSNIHQPFTFKLEGDTSKHKNIISETETLRQENARRMAGLAPASNDFKTMTYFQRIAQRIKPNIVFIEEIKENPTAEVEVTSAEDGKIIGVRLAESSGHKGWDEAVLKAVIRTQSLPLDTNGTIPKIMTLLFKPKE